MRINHDMHDKDEFCPPWICHWRPMWGTQDEIDAIISSGNGSEQKKQDIPVKESFWKCLIVKMLSALRPYAAPEIIATIVVITVFVTVLFLSFVL